jgi:chromosome segregation ATPase
MNKNIILLVFITLIAVMAGFVAFKYYSENQTLTSDNQTLTQAKEAIEKQMQGLKSDRDSQANEARTWKEKYNSIQNEVSSREAQIEKLQKRYDEAQADKAALIDKLNQLKEASSQQPQATAPVAAQQPQQPSEGAPTSGNDSYWADYVKNKAELETQLSDLNKQLADAKATINELDTRNKELSLKIDELTKEKTKSDEDMLFQQRTVDVMSRDLVKERESRQSSISDSDKLRQENVSLKREIVLANKEKLQMDDQLSKAIAKKEELEKMVSEVDNIFKEKKMALQELQDQLSSAIQSPDKSGSKLSNAISLPPIVVKPDVAGVQGVRGEVIAVNKDEKFIVIDKGETAGVRPGMTLKIMRGDASIGTAEVIETRKDISAADIKDVSGGFEIQEKDQAVTK